MSDRDENMSSAQTQDRRQQQHVQPSTTTSIEARPVVQIRSAVPVFHSPVKTRAMAKRRSMLGKFSPAPSKASSSSSCLSSSSSSNTDSASSQVPKSVRKSKLPSSKLRQVKTPSSSSTKVLHTQTKLSQFGVFRSTPAKEQQQQQQQQQKQPPSSAFAPNIAPSPLPNSTSNNSIFKDFQQSSPTKPPPEKLRNNLLPWSESMKPSSPFKKPLSPAKLPRPSPPAAKPPGSLKRRHPDHNKSPPFTSNKNSKNNNHIDGFDENENDNSLDSIDFLSPSKKRATLVETTTMAVPSPLVKPLQKSKHSNPSLSSTSTTQGNEKFQQKPPTLEISTPATAFSTSSPLSSPLSSPAPPSDDQERKVTDHSCMSRSPKKFDLKVATSSATTAKSTETKTQPGPVPTITIDTSTAGPSPTTDSSLDPEEPSVITPSSYSTQSTSLSASAPILAHAPTLSSADNDKDNHSQTTPSSSLDPPPALPAISVDKAMHADASAKLNHMRDALSKIALRRTSSDHHDVHKLPPPKLSPLSPPKKSATIPGPTSSQNKKRTSSTVLYRPGTKPSANHILARRSISDSTSQKPLEQDENTHPTNNNNNNNSKDDAQSSLKKKQIGPRPLKNVVVFVDVRTTEGDDAGGVFTNTLRSLGAKIALRLTSGLTHVVYKEGKSSTLHRIRSMPEPKPHVVGISWVLRCQELNEKADEANYKVKLPQNAVENFKRKSLVPKSLQSRLPRSVPNTMQATKSQSDPILHRKNSTTKIPVQQQKLSQSTISNFSKSTINE